ncbi:MAG TPA: sulfatase-like hydrolase/transferase [Candidatus Methanoperedens sp.]|nr:sulfatase-like hydrolase/transferase [Candidatus Methanoperedens sp.]
MISPAINGKKITNFLLIGISIVFTFIGILGIKKFYFAKNTNNLILPEQVCKNCNILLIDVDILRADALPCYGYFRNTAPNICNFASKSVLFKDNYSSSIWTLPSMFTTITGLNPPFHRVRTGMDKLYSNLPTLAESLKKQGYKTIFLNQDGSREVLINSYNGGLRGYDLVTNDPIEDVLANLSKSPQPWFIHYYRGDLHLPYLIKEGSTPIENLTPPKDFPITKFEFHQLLSKYLKSHRLDVFTKKALNDYSQYFNNIDLGSTNLATLFYEFALDPQKRGDYLSDIWAPVENSYLSPINPQKKSDLAFIRMMYDSVIREFDQNIAPLLTQITSGTYAKNTITIMMSDHGETFGEHGTFSHDNNHFSELFYTPLIIYSPKLTPTEVNHTSGNIDIYPTLLSLIGTTAPLEIQGKSLTPYLSKTDFDPSVFAYGEDFGAGTVLQNNRWLYFLPPNPKGIDSSELYNKIFDPLEKNNVYLKYPIMTQLLFNKATLFQSYDTTLKNTGETIPSYGGTKLTPEKIIRLKKEGYF